MPARRVLSDAAVLTASGAFGENWTHALDTYYFWKYTTGNLPTNLAVCSCCGATEFTALLRSYGRRDPLIRNWQKVTPYAPTPPFADQCDITFLADSTTTQGKWWVCSFCTTPAKRLKMQDTAIINNRQYVRKVLALPLLYTQMLSLVDISHNFTRKIASFACGEICEASMLDAPLLLYNAKLQQYIDRPPRFVLDFLFQQTLTNPLLRNYLTVLEQTSPSYGVPYLRLDEVDSARIAQIINRGPTGDNATSLNELCAVVDLRPIITRPPAQSKLYYIGRTAARTSSGDIDTDGMPLKLDLNMDAPRGPTALQPELLIFPLLFPHGEGCKPRGDKLQHYLQNRMSSMFSLFTLYKPYLPLMYLLRRTQELLTDVREETLQKHIHDHKQANPDADAGEIYRSVLKHAVPNTVVGSPAYFARKRGDCLAAASKFGLPHLFLTLTADECSELRWPEFPKLEQRLQSLHQDLNWNDAPVECARIFKARTDLFLQNYIFCPGGLLGAVKHYVVRYEFQMRGSPHAHIVLWLDPADVERVSKLIVAIIPGGDDEAIISALTEPEKTLRDIVLRKQIHSCGSSPNWKPCRHGRKDCKHGFPFKVNRSGTRFTGQRYEYLRLHPGDKNVSPYIPSLLLLWNAHLNVQRVSDTQWSAYMLKYALKCEPAAKLNLKLDTMHRLGLSGTFQEAQLKLASAAIFSQPVTPCEEAWHLLKYPIVQESYEVEFYFATPPDVRTQVALNGFFHNVTPAVDLYCQRPVVLHHLHFDAYFTQYVVSPKRKISASATVLFDMQDRTVTPQDPEKVVRFSEYSYSKQQESFFYRELLRRVPFTREEDLIGVDNITGTYFEQMQREGYINTTDDLLKIMRESNERQFLSEIDEHASMCELLSKYPHVANTTEGDLPLPSNGAPPAEPFNVDAFFEQQADEYADAPAITPTDEQDVVLQALHESSGGISYLTGGAGTGKTALTKLLVHELRQRGKRVLLCASTGAAAVRLSAYAQTAHSAFTLPCRDGQMLPPYRSTTDANQCLNAADVIVIDEISMLSSHIFNWIIYRFMQLTGTHTPQEALSDKLLLLVGDLCQLPPVCHHSGESNTMCASCHITHSPHWALITRHELTEVLRQQNDMPYVVFLNLLRTTQPTQAQIDTVLASCYIDSARVDELLLEARQSGEEIHILTSHREEMARYNAAMLAASFDGSDITSLPLYSNGSDHSELKAWLRDDKFNSLSKVAVGARVMLTTNNRTNRKLIANGTLGTVTALVSKANSSSIHKIMVAFDGAAEPTPVYKSKRSYKYHDGKKFFKTAFPLVLAYAFTIHKSQGMTLRAKTILHITECFCPGMTYVALSRATSRDNLFIVGSLPAEACVPVPAEFT